MKKKPVRRTEWSDPLPEQSPGKQKPQRPATLSRIERALTQALKNARGIQSPRTKMQVYMDARDSQLSLDVFAVEFKGLKDGVLASGFAARFKAIADAAQKELKPDLEALSVLAKSLTDDLQAALALKADDRGKT